MFVHGVDDELIPMDHTEKNQEAWGGPKEVNFCEGDHNSERPEDTMKQIADHLTKYLLS